MNKTIGGSMDKFNISIIAVVVIALLTTSNLVAANFASTQPMAPYNFMVYNDAVLMGYTDLKAANGSILMQSLNSSAVFNTASIDAGAINGSVFVKMGEYNNTNPVLLKNNTLWDGEDFGSHIFLAPNRPNSSNTYWYLWNVFLSDSTNFLENVTIRNLNLDGNYAHNPSLGGTSFPFTITHGCGVVEIEGGRFITVENCWIHDHVEWGLTLIALGGDIYGCTVRNNYIYNAQWNGITCSSWNYNNYGNTIEGNVLYGSIGDIALDLGEAGAGTCSRNNVINNRVLDMTGVNGSAVPPSLAALVYEGGGNITISGNSLVGKSGIIDNSNARGNNTITNNKIYIKADTVSSCYGIYLYGTGDGHNLVQGNTIMPFNSTANFNGMRFDGGNNRVISNTVICYAGTTCVLDYSANYYAFNDFSQGASTNWFYRGSGQNFPHAGSILEYNIGFVTKNTVTHVNTTATTCAVSHGLTWLIPNYVWVSFSTTAITGYTWTATDTTVTITVTGTLPSSWTCYIKAEYVP